MVSSPQARGESWQDLNWEFLQSTARIPLNKEAYRIHIIHYCSLFHLGQNLVNGTIRLGGWMFGKQRVPGDFLAKCEIPLFAELPLNALWEKQNRLSQRSENKEIVRLMSILEDETISLELFACPLLLLAVVLCVKGAVPCGGCAHIHQKPKKVQILGIKNGCLHHFPFVFRHRVFKIVLVSPPRCKERVKVSISW